MWVRLNEKQAAEVLDLARRIYRVLNSRLPMENSQQEFVADRMARLQAHDALDTIGEILDLNRERRA